MHRWERSGRKRRLTRLYSLFPIPRTALIATECLRVLGATESIIEAPLTIIRRYPAPNGREIERSLGEPAMEVGVGAHPLIGLVAEAIFHPGRNCDSICIKSKYPVPGTRGYDSIRAN